MIDKRADDGLLCVKCGHVCVGVRFRLHNVYVHNTSGKQEIVEVVFFYYQRIVRKQS